MPTQLILTLDDKGRLDVNGPIKNKLFCFGMLELAKEAITDFHKAQQATNEQRVQEVTPADLQGLGGLKVD